MRPLPRIPSPGGWPGTAAAVGAVAVVALVGLAAASPELARAVLVGVPAVVVPGLAFAWALAPDGWEDPLAHGVAALTAGFALAIGAGVLLGASPIGLSSPAWLVLLAGVTLAALALGRARRGGRLAGSGIGRRSGARPVGPLAGSLAPDAPMAAPALPARPAAPRRRDAGGLGLAVPLAVAALAILVAGVSLRIARLSVEAQVHPGFTQLWVLPVEGGDSLAISVQNREGATERYRLEVREGEEILETREAIELGDGERWTETVELDAPDGTLIEARLYRLPASEPYRTVSHVVGAG